MKHYLDSKFTLLFLNGRTTRFNIQMPRLVFYGGMSVLAFSICAFIYLIYFYSQFSLVHIKYETLKEKSQQQEQLLAQTDLSIQEIKSDIEDILETELHIHNLLKVTPSSKAYLQKKNRLRLNRFNSKFDQRKKEESPVSVLQQLGTDVVALKTKFTTHNQQLIAIQKRHNMTPSIWPVYGYIKSDYGTRQDPFSGTRKFHKGIDIPSWVGAPIKATADGIVEYSGWVRGYGFAIILNHSYGLRTYYAHMSLLMAKEGTYIKKGDIIGKIGTTGRSTGPHVHYEIRKWNKSLHPRRYLDNDMFTAYRSLW